MKMSYDRSVDAAYIQVAAEIEAGGVAKTYPCDPLEVGGEINLDFDAEGRLIGIEVLDASKKLPLELLELSHNSRHPPAAELETSDDADV